MRGKEERRQIEAGAAWLRFIKHNDRRRCPARDDANEGPSVGQAVTRRESGGVFLRTATYTSHLKEICTKSCAG
jgi:hypothetical protein